MNDRLPVLRHWTLAIDRYPSKPNGDSLLDPARKGTRAWYESHPEAWELVEVVPADDLAGAVEALREIAKSEGTEGVIAANALADLGVGDPLLDRFGGSP